MVWRVCNAPSVVVRPSSTLTYPLVLTGVSVKPDWAVKKAMGMYLVAMGWLYVAMMMAVAEATHPDGTVLGAMVTFLLYGLLPMALALYVLNTPQRRKARLAAEAEADAAARAAGAAVLAAQAEPSNTPSAQPNASGHASGAAERGGIAPVRKPD